MIPSQAHWHILGAGAIGSLWAAYCYRAAHPATLILRSEQRLAEYQRAGGMLLTSADGGPTLLALPATCSALLREPITHLLVTCKAHQTLAALTDIAPAMHDKATIVLLQNGLGVAEAVAARYPGVTLLQGSTSEGVYRQGHFSLVHAGRGATFLGQSAQLLAETGQAPVDRATLAQLAASLSAEPLSVEVSPDIDAILWRKLMVNCAINPLTVKYRCRNGELLENPSALTELETVVTELTNLHPCNDLLASVKQVATDTARNRSSMLQDVEAGRATEIDYITGYVCRLAARQNLPLPANQALLAYIRALTA